MHKLQFSAIVSTSVLCFEQSRIVYRTFRILRVSLMEDSKESLCARVQSATLLWDPTHQDYKNKDQRQQGLGRDPVPSEK